MDGFRSFPDQKREPSLRGRFSFFSMREEAGSVLLYILMAMGLLAALTYAYIKDSRENYASQSAVQIAETLNSQANLIRSAVVQCAMEYPQGGGNLNNTGGSANIIDYADNPNNPYPLNPSSPLNPSPAANDYAKNLMCFTAPAVYDNTGTLISGAVTSGMFSGANNQGRFLPPPPAGFSEWTYVNNTTLTPAPNGRGVYIQITAPNDASAINALTRVMSKYAQYQADLNYDGGSGACGARCITIWIQRNCTTTCP
jgi:hypothetical protein